MQEDSGKIVSEQSMGTSPFQDSCHSGKHIKQTMCAEMVNCDQIAKEFDDLIFELSETSTEKHQDAKVFCKLIESLSDISEYENQKFVIEKSQERDEKDRILKYLPPNKYKNVNNEPQCEHNLHLFGNESFSSGPSQTNQSNLCTENMEHLTAKHVKTLCTDRFKKDAKDSILNDVLEKNETVTKPNSKISAENLHRNALFFENQDRLQWVDSGLWKLQSNSSLHTAPNMQKVLGRKNAICSKSLSSTPKKDTFPLFGKSEHEKLMEISCPSNLTNIYDKNHLDGKYKSKHLDTAIEMHMGSRRNFDKFPSCSSKSKTSPEDGFVKSSYSEAAIKYPESECNTQHKCFLVHLYIEDKKSHAGPFTFEVYSKMTLRLLKFKVEQEFGIIASFQKWILGNSLAVDNDKPLCKYGTFPGSPIFLYVDSTCQKLQDVQKTSSSFMPEILCEGGKSNQKAKSVPSSFDDPKSIAKKGYKNSSEGYRICKNVKKHRFKDNSVSSPFVISNIGCSELLNPNSVDLFSKKSFVGSQDIKKKEFDETVLGNKVHMSKKSFQTQNSTFLKTALLEPCDQTFFQMEKDELSIEAIVKDHSDSESSETSYQSFDACDIILSDSSIDDSDSSRGKKLTHYVSNQNFASEKYINLLCQNTDDENKFQDTVLKEKPENNLYAEIGDEFQDSLIVPEHSDKTDSKCLQETKPNKTSFLKKLIAKNKRNELNSQVHSISEDKLDDNSVLNNFHSSQNDEISNSDLFVQKDGDAEVHLIAGPDIKNSKEKETECNPESTENYAFLLQIEDLDVVKNVLNFNCPICFVEIEAGQGVVLHDCLHVFCRECLSYTINYAESALIKCPYRDDVYSCESCLQQREIKALVSTEDYEKYLQRSVVTAESLAEKSFHCKTPDCHGWCMFEDNINIFQCPVCLHYNCLNCNAIHEGLNCRQYQDKLKYQEKINEDAEKTLEFLNKMIESGKAMKCPKCDLILMKKWGCDWLKCSVCHTEICWVTKGPRWGPSGQGDITAGCRCGVNGIKCHPSCTYCH